MLLPNGKIKLIDLGIAARMSDVSSSSGFGTPAYMPPEQSEKGKCGRYTDIFALGVVLFEMLTGQVPFTSQNQSARLASEEIKYKIKYEATPQMKRFYPAINSNLQFIVERALDKNPADRYQSCEEFQKVIRNYMYKHKLK
jgi:serine/threonine-protein kinase